MKIFNLIFITVLLFIAACSTSTETTKTHTEQIDYTTPPAKIEENFELPGVSEPTVIEKGDSKLTVQPDGSFQAEVKDEEKGLSTTVDYQASKPAADNTPAIPASVNIKTEQEEKDISAKKTTTDSEKNEKTESAGDWLKDVYKSTITRIIGLVFILLIAVVIIKKIFPNLLSKIL